MPDDRLHILIVDDDALDRAETRRTLLTSALSPEITEVGTCVGAVQALVRNSYDCVLLDFQLPDGTGLDVLRQAQAAGVKAPIIMVTGYGDELTAVELMKAGAADYLSKTRLTTEGLERAVRTAVRLRRVEQQAREADDARLRSEAQFRRVAESNIIGILFYDLYGGVVDANDAFLEMIGYTRDELAAGLINWQALTPAEWRDQDRVRVGELEALGTCAPFEKEYVRKDGGRVAVLISASMLDEAGGQGLAFVVDVTERRRAEQSQTFLAEAGAILSSSLNYPETLSNVAALAVPHLADWCAVDLREEGGAIRRVAITHVDPAQAEAAWEMDRRFPIDPQGKNGPAQVMRTGVAELVADLPHDTLAAYAQSAEHLEVLRRAGLRSYLCVPLTARGHVLGAITLLMSQSGRRYTPADLALAEELARHAALAVDNARLFFETRARAEREAVVNAIGQALRGSLDADEILEVATTEIGQLLEVSRCGWYWINTDLDALEVAPQQYVASDAEAFSGEFPLSLWAPDVLRRWSDGEPVVSADCAGDAQVAAYRDSFLSPMNIRAFIACPVFLRGAWAGLFVVHQTDGARAWTAEEVALLRQVADMLAPTLENARLYAREHRVADMLQAAFLSNIPDRLAGLDLGTVYRPGLDEAQVGGDFYDVFSLPDGRVGLVMGDVSGKGLSAAVLTATVKFSLRAFAAEVAAPSLVLTRLNRTLCSEAAGLGDHFVTLFYGVVDSLNGRLAYASAGHETQIIKRTSGGTTLLHSTGPILGIAEHRFEQRRADLAPGDALVLFTDGLTEARSAKTRDLFDLSRVTQLIDTVPPELGAGGLAAFLERSALDWTAGRPQDDLALLIARRTEDDELLLPSPPRARSADALGLKSAPPTDRETLFQFDFPSRPDYAAEVRQATAHWMSTLGYRREQVEDFQTAITEAVTNAVRHGSPRGDADHFRVTAYRLVDVAIAVEVTDSGPGLPDPHAAHPMPEPEATGGRGLPLMQHLADTVQYVPTGHGLCVRLVKNHAPDTN